MDHLLKIVDAAPRTARIIRPKSYGHQQRLLCENNALWPVCVKYLAGVCTTQSVVYSLQCGTKSGAFSVQSKTVPKCAKYLRCMHL